MKKWAYLFGGFVIGAVVVASGDTVIAQVKSLVGQKVTGEYKVIVNGKELQDKGSVISGRTNAPVRAISESIGADLKVDNKAKVITITTDESPDVHTPGDGAGTDDHRISSLQNQKNYLESEIKGLKESKEREEKQYVLLDEGLPKELLRQSLDSLNKQLDEKNQELAKVNVELAALEK